ncbi:hypothetical protein [Streptomyces sp. NPDC053079]|uniref:hypothetical protein n=1 Tax=Streptomyces sp. NPDC053079 TaxID=3365697 RepID=UPI0037D2E493
MDTPALSRRTALRAATGLAVGGATLGLGAPAAHAAGQFQDVRQFKGTWLGSYDGRNARLTITVVGVGPGFFHVGFEYVDLDRSLRYTASLDGIAASTRQFHNLILNGPDQLLWPRLSLHTWNTDYLSGVSQWSNADYGFSFAREGVAEPYITPPRRFNGSSSADVLGGYLSTGPISLPVVHDHYAHYEGRIDGRAAQLNTYAANNGGGRIYFELWDNATGWYTWFDRTSTVDWRHPLWPDAWMAALTKNTGDLRLRGLFWHTWNCWYVSGETVWNGQYYGMSFTRRTRFANPDGS